MRLFPAAALLFAASCSAPPAPPIDAGDLLPGWTLVDVNPASARSGQNVSPKDYLGKVSAWYFGHSG